MQPSELQLLLLNGLYWVLSSLAEAVPLLVGGGIGYWVGRKHGRRSPKEQT